MRRPRRLLRVALNLRPLPKLSRVGPQLPVGVGLTGPEEARWRVFVSDVERDELVHREPAVQVGHGAFKRPRILPAARRLRYHSFYRFLGGAGAADVVARELTRRDIWP